MNSLPIPENENQRIETLKSFNILDALPEKQVEQIMELAAAICEVPISLVSLIDEERQWFYAKKGLEVDETPREISFCQYAIMEEALFEVENALEDERFKDNPLVTGAPYIRFYAGFPLFVNEEHALGTLCVISDQPKKLNPHQQKALRILAKNVVNSIKLQQEIRVRRQAEVELQQALKAKTDFLANISHEIRTPLNAILGMTELLIDNQPAQQQIQFLQSIKKAGDHLLVIINDVLDSAKIESGILTLEQAPFSPEASFNQIKKLLRDKALEKNLQFNFYLEADLPEYVIGDEVRFNQILFNLIGNAIKFTPEGKVDVFCKVLKKEKKGCTLQIRVVDTGIGINEDELGYIFKRFKQGDNSTTRKYGGTGLGLNITKELLQLYGGSLQFEHNQKKGSIFIATIPFNISDTPKTRIKLTEASQIPDLTGKKILLVEDNELNQVVAQQFLEKTGAKLFLVDNGKTALEVIEKQQLDLILMDLQIPEIDGYECTQIIREELQLHIPIIAMTAHSLVGERGKCLTIGMDDYLSKPYKKADLYRVLVRQFQLQKHKTLNIQLFQERTGKNTILEQKLIDRFLSTVPPKLDELKNAISEKNYTEVKEIAHHLKTSFDFFGAQKAYYSCQKMEEQTQKVDLSELFQQLKKEQIHIQKLLRDYLEEMLGE